MNSIVVIYDIISVMVIIWNSEWVYLLVFDVVVVMGRKLVVVIRVLVSIGNVVDF